MIQKYSQKTLLLWSRGELKVEIRTPMSDRPVAYCDGTDEDLAELAHIAEEEGAEAPEVHRRILKTGREIWTVGSPPTDLPYEDD